MADFVKTHGWGQFRRSIDPKKFNARQRAFILRATTMNAMDVRSSMKRKIRSGVEPGNADLTALIKGSTKALADQGDLFQMCTIKVIDWKTAFVGWLKQARSSAGTPMVNVVATLHEGATIRVTRKMRAMFWYLWLVSQGRMDSSKLTGRAQEIWDRIGGKKRVIKPLNESTSAIRIPGRPFIREVFDDTTVKARIINRWVRAIDSALRVR